MPISSETKEVVIGLALLVGLVTLETLRRVPNGRAVFAQAVHDVNVNSQPVARAVEERPVVRITVSNFKFSPDHITLRKGQPVTLRLMSRDQPYRFLLRALKIDADVPAGKPFTVTVTPQVAGTFKATSDHHFIFGRRNMKMTVLVE